MIGPSSFVQLIYLFRPSFFWKQESQQFMALLRFDRPVMSRVASCFSGDRHLEC